jgi:hypothetical protein
MDRMDVRRLCSLVVKSYASHKSRHPKALERIAVDTHSRPFFKPSKDLIEQVRVMLFSPNHLRVTGLIMAFSHLYHIPSEPWAMYKDY